jgi:hypothetical protein
MKFAFDPDRRSASPGITQVRILYVVYDANDSARTEHLLQHGSRHGPFLPRNQFWEFQLPIDLTYGNTPMRSDGEPAWASTIPAGNRMLCGS